MTLPKWIDARITIGTIIQVATFIVIAVVGFARLQAAEQQLRLAVDVLQIEVVTVKREYRSIAVDNEFRQRVLERLEDLRERLARVERRMDK